MTPGSDDHACVRLCLPPNPEVDEWSLPLGDRRGSPLIGLGPPVLRPEWIWPTVAAGSPEAGVVNQWRQVCEERGFPPRDADVSRDRPRYGCLSDRHEDCRRRPV